MKSDQKEVLTRLNYEISLKSCVDNLCTTARLLPVKLVILGRSLNLRSFLCSAKANNGTTERSRIFMRFKNWRSLGFQSANMGLTWWARQHFSSSITCTTFPVPNANQESFLSEQAKYLQKVPVLWNWAVAMSSISYQASYHHNVLPASQNISLHCLS